MSSTPIRHNHKPIETYTSIPAPATSPSLCLLGTSAGAALIHETGTPRLLPPTLPHGPTFALDISPLSPNLVVTGGRKGIIATTDLRTTSAAGSFRLGTAATHLRIAPDGNEHAVLVAGVGDTMAIYDRRWTGQSTALPVVTFPEYRNAARVRIGWDLCREAGVVVAAEGSGSVGLYSVFSGGRVGELPLGGRGSRGSGGDGGGEEEPVECLRVAKVGGDAVPSVFVAAGGGVVKFSCNLGDDDGP